MKVEECRGRLEKALPLRMPMFDPNEAPALKIAALEEYLRTTAIHRGELAEALHWIWEAQKLLRQQWMDVQGWEPMAGSKPTQAQIDAAKRQIAPGVYAGLQDADLLARSIDHQIKRLALDDAAASRAYTMLTGT